MIKLSDGEPFIAPPTVGRIVHYQPFHQLAPLAAIVTMVHDKHTVNLTVFNADGTTKPALNVAYSSIPSEGCWSWPR